jgi:hypothetical protein
MRPATYGRNSRLMTSFARPQRWRCGRQTSLWRHANLPIAYIKCSAIRYLRRADTSRLGAARPLRRRLATIREYGPRMNAPESGERLGVALRLVCRARGVTRCLWRGVVCHWSAKASRAPSTLTHGQTCRFVSWAPIRFFDADPPSLASIGKNIWNSYSSLAVFTQSRMRWRKP